jgi:uncharacterized protein (TIGR02646 family)
MIFFPKSQPAPDCLATEMLKTSGDYNCSGVVSRLKDDFKNKCYLCEQKSPTSINIEHFIPHGGDHIFKFDWNNLFFSCAHCNNVKSSWQTRTKFTDLLNCTLAEDRVDQIMEYHFDVSTPQGTLAKEHVRISALRDEARVQRTAELLNEIFQGTTVQKVIESANLREKLLEEMRALIDLVSKFLQAKTPTLQQRRKEEIMKHLQSDSAFTAFKRNLIRNHHRFASWLNESSFS